MKKLYFLNEEEKQRILNIHESATSRQYLGEQNTNSPVVTKAYEEILKGFNGPGTDADMIINGLKNLTTNEFWELNQMFATKKPLGFASFQDMINSEFEYTEYQMTTNSNDVYEIRKKLKELGISSTITKTDDGTIYKKGSFKITSQPNGNSSKPLNATQGQKSQQYKQQIIAKTKENTMAIQRLLGLEQTGVMDSALLQKINEKLNGTVEQQKRPEVQAINPSTLQPADLVNKPLNVQAGFQDQVNQISKMLQQQQLQQQQLNAPKNKKK
jgi:hypothetical protein